jgi:hypothetical protein
MNATELTTSEWLGSKGYCVMSSVKFGRREADLLAVRPTDMARLHVEVSVSSRPFGSNRATEEYEKDVRDFIEKKFEALKDQVQGILGGDYQRWLVIGKMAGGQCEEDIWIARMRDAGVTVHRFEDVVRDYVQSFTVRPTGLTGDLLDVLNQLGLLKIV